MGVVQVLEFRNITFDFSLFLRATFEIILINCDLA